MGFPLCGDSVYSVAQVAKTRKGMGSCGAITPVCSKYTDGEVPACAGKIGVRVYSWCDGFCVAGVYNHFDGWFPVVK